MREIKLTGKIMKLGNSFFFRIPTALVKHNIVEVGREHTLVFDDLFIGKYNNFDESGVYVSHRDSRDYKVPLHLKDQQEVLMATKKKKSLQSIKNKDEKVQKPPI